MRAITVKPGTADSACLEEVAAPSPSEGSVLVRAIALGICGTDREIIEGLYGEAPPGQDRLILGHESLGRVEDAPPGCGLHKGDMVVGIVRRPDPVPCPACAAGEWDMCRNGLFTERGIKARNGYGAEYFRLEPEFAIKVSAELGFNAVLMEPASVVAKAWDHVERIGRRTATWRPQTVLVTGGGPIGLLAALIGRQRGLDVHVLDRHRDGPKPGLVADIGGHYHPDMTSLADWRFDIVMECTAATPVIAEAIGRCAPAGVVCLVGVSSAGRKSEFDIGGFNRTLVLNNEVVFGSVNANLKHYAAAQAILRQADRAWLDRLITRRIPLDRWREALDNRADDIKVVIDFRA